MRGLISQFSSFSIALIFAVILWAIATSEAYPSREAFFPEPLPVEIANQPDGVIVFQKSAETARVKVRAPLALWEQLRAQSFRVVVDLTGATAGIFQTEPRAQAFDPRVTVTAVEPPMVSLRLDRLVTRELPVEPELTDAPPVGYVNKPPQANPARVRVSGPAALVDQVAQVDADVSLRGSKATVERVAPVVTRDARGNVVAGVTVTPAEVSITVQIEPRVGYKDVSVKTMLKGVVAAGYWISNIVTAPSTATVAGSAEALSKLPGFVETLPIDVNAATGDVVKTVPLQLPEGVSMLDNDGVTVQISVTPILGGQTIRRAVTAQGLRRGLGATISPDTVEVILSGPLPALTGLTAQDVQVMIDAAGLAPGAYTLKPRVIIVPAALKVQNLSPDTVLVNIVEANPK